MNFGQLKIKNYKIILRYFEIGFKKVVQDHSFRHKIKYEYCTNVSSDLRSFHYN